MSAKEIMVGGKPLSSLRVVDLKEELEKRGLSKSGSKKDLADRLRMNILLENQRNAQSSADEEQLPNLSTREQLAEQNPFIRDYFASQAELYHSQKVVKKLYEGMAQTPQEQQQQQQQQQQGQPSSIPAESTKPPPGPPPVKDTEEEGQASPPPLPPRVTRGTERQASPPPKVKQVTEEVEAPPPPRVRRGREAPPAATQLAETQPAAQADEEEKQEEAPSKAAAVPSATPKESNGNALEKMEKRVTRQQVSVPQESAEEQKEDEKESSSKPVETAEDLTKAEDKAEAPKAIQVTDKAEPAKAVEKVPEETELPKEVEQVSDKPEPVMTAEDVKVPDKPEPPKVVEEIPEKTEPTKAGEKVADKPEPDATAELSPPEPMETEAPVEPQKVSKEKEEDEPSAPVTEAEIKPVKAYVTGEEQKAGKSSTEKDDSEEQEKEEKAVVLETKAAVAGDDEGKKSVSDDEEEDEEDEEEAEEKKHDEGTWKRRANHKPVSAPEEDQPDDTLQIQAEETKETRLDIRSSSPGSENIEKPKLITSRSDQMDVDEALDYGEEEVESNKKDSGSFSWSRRILRLKNRVSILEKPEKKWNRVDRKPVVVTSKVLETFFPDVKPLPESEVRLEERIPKEPPEDVEKGIKREHHAPSESLDNNKANNDGVLPNVKRKISIIPFEETTKELTPPRNMPSDVLVITNLTRPFTLMQLRELLQRTGTLEQIWVDKIKSKCIAKFESQSEAEETRGALHGIQWPPSNPKALVVDFTTQSELEEVLNKDSSVDKKQIEKPAEANNLPVREWDLGKRSRSRSPPPGSRGKQLDRTGRGRSGSPERKRSRRSPSPRGGARRSPHHDKKSRDHDSKEEPQIKALDELFRKTTTTPCLYWLPLTPEQIAEKEELRRKRMLERERRLAEMEKLRPR